MSGGGLAAGLVGVEGDGLDLLKHLFYCLHKNFSFPLLVFSVKIAYNRDRKIHLILPQTADRRVVICRCRWKNAIRWPTH